MSIATLIRAMADAGATPEAIAIAVEAIERRDEREADRKAKRAEQKRQERARRATVARQDGDRGATDLSPKKEIPPTPPKEKTTPIPVSEPNGSSTESAREFAAFWSLFPNKVGKRDAETRFAAARKRASFDAIMAGLRRYVAKTDDRPWCNPATFLNQGRWDDQPADAPIRNGTGPPRGKRPNAVEANRRITEQEHERASQERDNRDAELLPPNEPRLRTLVADVGRSLRWDQ